MNTAEPSTLPLLTPRLRLRPFHRSDAEELYAIYSHPRVQALIGTHTRQEVDQEIAFDIAHQASHGWSLWAMEERESGRLIGDCGLRPLEMRGPEIELGYDLHPDQWGRGLASEAARASVGLGLGVLAIERVVAVVKPGHAASRRVLEKAGLSLVGERRAYGEDLLLYEARRPRPST